MKILIIGFTKIKYMPYMNFYLDNIDKNSNEIHLIYWNRDLKKENTDFLKNIKLHEFLCYQEDEISKVSKIGSFIKFRKFVLNIIKKEPFDFVIFLHSLTGVLIADKIQRKYANRYIFDYRDSTYEGFAPFKYIIWNLVKKSYVTFVSSDGFRRFLPESESDKIYTSHNLLTDSLNHRDEKKKYGIKSDKIRIGFWGFIRHEEVNKEIIKKISEDNRFELHYYGREQETALNLKKYVAEIGAKNIYFHGEYKPEDRYEFVRNTDIIHNIYCDKNTMLAMGNKYYDSIIFYLPQICMKGSFMAEKVGNAGIGFSCDPYDDDCSDKIYKYYTNIDISTLTKNCDIELEKIMKECRKGISIIKNIDLK